MIEKFRIWLSKSLFKLRKNRVIIWAGPPIVKANTAGKSTYNASLMTRSRTKTKRLTKWDRDYLWHPFTQMRDWVKEEPIIIERGRGAALYDTEGRRYLDGTSSIWLNVHGHRHPALDRALRAQLKKVARTTLLGLSNPPAIQLARELVRRAPRGLSKV